MGGKPPSAPRPIATGADRFKTGEMRCQFLLCASLLALTTVASADQLRPLITADDYPREALRNHWQGDVAVDVTISPKGRVTACKVAKSSGHQVLDDATCKAVTERAHFKPATDKAGSAVETHLTLGPIRWSLPE